MMLNSISVIITPIPTIPSMIILLLLLVLPKSDPPSGD